MQDEHDLNWYSYRYRNYDPAIGRFFNVDPLSESFAYNGVYNFSENRVIDGFELEGLETILVNDVTGETKQSKPVELDTVEFGPRKSAPVEYYPVQNHMNGLIHYDYSVAQNQMELVGNNHSYFATPLYSNSSGLVGFGIATGEGRLDYVIDKGKFNDFTRNIDGHYQSADWLSFALQTGNQEHILNYWAATREGTLGDVFSANWQLTKDQWTFKILWVV
ncbi:RHS repeat-associated core domain-containing protein [Moheibacter sediminis]|uniref:RHS repeat-associated core domain-containing protein n=1 Tax=Moheibacter sediminis TaxID=1434700 RepID=A0A1W1ZJZ3_9FLAO|nr:RHS repeat-associated core domain-containing protein [Moheibacter sediminis]